MNQRPGEREILHRQAEQQIHRAKTEERNVAEPIHPAFETRVAAEPVFAAKEKSEHHAGDEAEQQPEPRQDEIDLGDFIFYCQASLSTLAVEVLIDKTLASIA